MNTRKSRKNTEIINMIKHSLLLPINKVRISYGATGPRSGATGPTGPRGVTGQRGANGVTGPTGQRGANGVTGQRGANGVTGQRGANGVTGPTGQRGANGVTGVRGVTGPTGLIGLTGSAGTTGPTGPVGGPVGNTGPTGGIGPTGVGVTNPSTIILDFIDIADSIYNITSFSNNIISTFIFTNTSDLPIKTLIFLPNVIISGTIIYIYFTGNAGQLVLIPNSPNIFINLNLDNNITVSPTGCAVLITSIGGPSTGYYSLSNLGAGITYSP